MNSFIENYRWYIFSFLLFFIVAGSSLILWNRSSQNYQLHQSQQIKNLEKQNDELRQLLKENQGSVAGESDESDESDKTNINTATAEELDVLPNIGPARAQDIIEYRQSSGGFKTIEEIKNIKGIGDKSFEELKNLITVGE